MIIDTERLDNFIKAHKCQIDSKAKNFEDALIYVNYKTGKWKSVYEQLKKDMELEEKWDELNNASFLKAYEYFKDTEHSGDTELILANDWQEYKAGTSQYEIWDDMFEKYSGGSKLAEHPIYDDSEKSKLKIPDIIKDLFLDSKIIIRINNEREHQIFLENFKNDIKLISLSYKPEYTYYLADNGGNNLARYSTVILEPDLDDKLELDLEEIYEISQVKKIPDAIIDMFINKELAIQVNSKPEQHMLFLTLYDSGKFKITLKDYPFYHKEYPFYCINTVNKVDDKQYMEDIVEIDNIKQFVEFNDFNNISKVTEFERDNDIDLEER